MDVELQMLGEGKASGLKTENTKVSGGTIDKIENSKWLNPSEA